MKQGEADSEQLLSAFLAALANHLTRGAGKAKLAAEAIGVSQSQLSRWSRKRGGGMPSTKTWLRLIEASPTVAEWVADGIETLSGADAPKPVLGPDIQEQLSSVLVRLDLLEEWQDEATRAIDDHERKLSKPSDESEDEAKPPYASTQ